MQFHVLARQNGISMMNMEIPDVLTWSGCILQVIYQGEFTC